MTNLVVNGDFEADFFGYTTTGQTGIFDGAGIGGSKAALTVFNETGSTISQTNIPTIAGTEYVFTIYMRPGSIVDVNNPIVLDINGTIYPLYTTNIEVYNQFVFIFVAPGTTTFTIISNNNNLTFYDDISIVNSGICYSKNSKVYVREIDTNLKKNIRVRDVHPEKHLVFDTDSNKFIPIKYNIISGPRDKLFVIKKNSIADGVPFEDFYVTSGHRLVIDGQEIKARDIPGAKKIKVKPQMVYSICTEKRTTISINNLNVMTHGKNEWLRYAKINKILWSNNTA